MDYSDVSSYVGSTFFLKSYFPKVYYIRLDEINLDQVGYVRLGRFIMREENFLRKIIIRTLIETVNRLTCNRQ